VQWFLEATTTGHKIALMVFAILLFAAVMAAILFAVDRPKRVPNWIVAAGFVGPTLLLLAVGLVYPALETVRGSFYNRDGSSFVGLDNYVTVFSEDNFQTVLFNTLLWVVLVPLVTTGLGLVYAYLVDRTRFEKLAKALVFLPMAISMVGAGVIWKFVYEYRPDQPGVRQIGLLNQVLVLLGFEPQQFLLNAPSNSFYLIVVMIWIQAGFAMTVLSAAIKAIPDDVVEAARLDGVGGLQMFRYVTVPSIRPALVVVLTTVAITTLKVFDIVRTMTGGQFSTSVVANEFYVQAFRQFNFGLGAALAVLLFLLVIPIIAYNVRQLRLAEELR
jgi:alpha-glucoside transport system permease protein